jgi:hypothetical protein
MSLWFYRLYHFLNKPQKYKNAAYAALKGMLQLDE